MNKAPKQGFMSTLSRYFNFGGKRYNHRRSHGNHTLPKEMQKEVKQAADARNLRRQKTDSRQMTRLQQNRLGLFS